MGQHSPSSSILRVADRRAPPLPCTQLVPTWATYQLWPITPGMSPGLRGVRDAVILILSTSFCFGAVTAFILNLIVPASTEMPRHVEEEELDGEHWADGWADGWRDGWADGRMQRQAGG